MKYKRPHFDIVKKRIEEPKKFIQVIVGPRQVGKTTLILQLLDEITIPYHFASADNVPNTNLNWIDQQWEISRIKWKSTNADSLLLVIDEIQKINSWSDAVKSHWEKDIREKNNIKVILLGSSQLLLQKGLTESLAGRFELIRMNHWPFNEMKQAFNLTEEKFIWFGSYPGAVDLIDDEIRWKDYVKNSLIETTISKDILMMNRVDKPALLKNLFELGSYYSGQVLSFNKILGQLHNAGNTTTLSHYLELLSSASLLTGLEKFSENKIRQRSSSPKFQVYNTALISAQSQLTFNEATTKPNYWGRIVESAIGAHLLNFAHSENLNVFYWRHRNDEIDFVIKYKHDVIAIEIKSGRNKAAAGIETFRKMFNPQKVLLVGGGGLDWKEFIKINPIDLFS